MDAILSGFALGLVLANVTPSPAFPLITAESAIGRYCEPLIAGSSAAQIVKAAKADGFKDEKVGEQPVLMLGELIVSVSEAPRVCLIQAPTSMTFAQGLAVVDAWAARHSGARQGAATKGPDGAPVRMWAVPGQKKYLLVTQQTNARGQKALNFILAPLPTS